MRVILKKSKDNSITDWSGGKTTELFIYPENSTYHEGDFQVRLSTATVEIETSTFTPLPEVSRTLMVLEGNMRLEHEGHHTINLSPLKFDRFDGGWTTKSIGTCVDFNLMTKNEAKGELEGFELKENGEDTFDLSNTHDLFGFYLYKGIVELALPSSTVKLHQGDCLIIEHPQSIKMIISTLADSVGVIAKIKS